MANNLIQIKRSTSTSVPASLANGELAYTSAGDVLFIGSPANSTPIAIGGIRSPGTLTANQSVVVDGNSLVNTIKVGTTAVNVTVNATSIFLSNSTSNTKLTIPSSAQWTAGDYFLNANGEWSQVDLTTISINDLDDVTITSVANNNLLVYDQATSVWVNKAAGNGFAFATHTPYVLANNGIISNTSGLFADAANGINVTTDGINVLAGNSQLVSNTTGLWIDQSQINHDSLLGFVSNEHIDHSSVSVSSGDGLVGGGDITTSRTISVLANSGIIANTTGVFVDGANGIIVTGDGVNVKAGNSQLISNTTGLWIDQSQINHDSLLGFVSNEHVDHSSVSISSGNGLTGGGDITASRTLSVVGANGIVVTGDGVNVKAGTGVVSNATGVHIGQDVATTAAVTFQDLTVNGNTVLGSDTADVISVRGLVNTNIIPSANVTYNLGNNTLRWYEIHASNVHSEFLYIDKDVSISGNLYVTGNLVSINVSSLSVHDSLIQLAGNNTVSDILDIGFFGNYNPDAGGHEHTGLFRDATDGIYKLFQGLEPAPTTTVDTGDASFEIATLQAYLNSGGLIANATHVQLTANSTINVSITANSITLNTPLAATSGGTGLNTYTSQDILVANATNGFAKLSLGSAGYVLQSNGTALVYATLDGGEF